MTTTPTPAPVPRLLKPGRRSWEQLVDYRLRRMAELLTRGVSYRAIAKDLGVAHQTVLRMKADAAGMSAFTKYLGPIDVVAR